VLVSTYTLSLGVMGEMGSTIVGVLTPFLFDKAPPIESQKRLSIRKDDKA
jgi:hypothetical protein